MAHCGRKTRQFIGHGSGIGGTRKAAVDVANTIAAIVAKAEAQEWINKQKCKKECPFRSESIIPWGNPRTRYAIKAAPGLWIALVSYTFQANVWCKKTAEEEGPGEGGD